MKILLVNKYWYLRGGTERVVFATKKVLEENGHEVEVFGMKHKRNIIANDYFVDNIDYDNVRGIKKIKAGMAVINNKKARASFKKLVDDFQPDLIHFHNIYHQLSFSLFDAVKDSGIPSVMTLHDYKMISPNFLMFHHGKIDESCLSGKYYQCLLKNCGESLPASLIMTLEAYYRKIKKYQAVPKMYISPSEFLKNKFIQAGWDGEKIEVILNPVDARNTKYEIRNTKSENYVAFVGRLSKEKGLDVLLEAAEKTPKIDYKIIGSGPLEQKLKLQVTSYKLQNIQFEGYQAGEKLQQLISGAKLVVVPSICYENSPLSVLEIKATGKIVIGSNIGGIPELLPKELLFKTGDSADLARQIKTWYDKPLSETRKLREKMQKEVKDKHSFTAYYESLEKLYSRFV